MGHFAPVWAIGILATYLSIVSSLQSFKIPKEQDIEEEMQVVIDLVKRMEKVVSFLKITVI